MDVKIVLKWLLITILAVLIIPDQVKATHIRAGEITAEVISCQTFTYRITIYGYTFTGSPVLFGGGELTMGDGSEPKTFSTGDYDFFQDLGDQIAVNVFIVEHTFPGPGVYTIRFREFNRNGGIVNMDNSINTPFYVETILTIDPFLGCNSTPILLNPPIDRGCVGVAFFHNPGAFDADGDSLAYKLTVSKQNRDVPVVNYRFPNVYDIAAYGTLRENGSGPAIYSIDPITGDLIWDAPGGEGEYNLAFIIEEWRKVEGEWFLLGYVTRDMQVIVVDCDNQRPELTIPPDTCVTAGSLLEQIITASDPDGHDVIIEPFGGVFEIPISPATFRPRPAVVQPSPARLDFIWQTVCQHVNVTPYRVNFKATDDPPRGSGPRLADYATWQIRVVGPPPENLIAEQAPNTSIQLNWDRYSCQNATRMQIWRRVDSFQYVPANCELGIPANGGYELIDVVPIGQSAYLDDNFGQGLDFGAKYCYRLVAVFENPNGGESYVSQEVCVDIEDEEGRFGGLMTNVSVTVTGESNGQVFVRWTSPFEIDESVFPPPYTYELYRANGFSGGNPQLISGGRISDTTFTDTGLNTRNEVFNYRVIAYDGNLEPLHTTLSASTVRLELSPITGAMGLDWRAVVPWSNISQRFPIHYIYRNQVPGFPAAQLVLIDSVNVTSAGLTYVDNGQATGQERLNDEIEYCYYVTTSGTYGNPLVLEPLLNDSQLACAQPKDSIPPCAPRQLTLLPDCESVLLTENCDFNDFYNELFWEADFSGDCDLDVRSYNIYFSPTGDEDDFNLIANVTDTYFLHENIPSFAGCYRVTAIDRSGNESSFSDVLCNDNCPYYELPNVITPNNDGLNDTFRAYDEIDPLNNVNRCPRFVQSVEFRVYNRWGKEVFNNEGSRERTIFINWDGKTNDGRLLSSGVYYYIAKVKFKVLDPSKQSREFKGWIQVLRE
ncbi:MAG: gliding motility-associated C-terminal domain-containing protein [Cyclobacteriaceae bacterium]|nr:gliding motility-associated C-terminal domain-containing protein [Cyclobacteriaceae bacterium]